jgi:hypothetical protein
MCPLVCAEASDGIRGEWWGLHAWGDSTGIGWTMRRVRAVG